ncbi:hypothetical protein RhiirA1_476867 [Rhizophagus irregularis]|uniref:Uncharacterized protein n=2 Tax=Rhizophagus irregularis TaxID=588596 RepID=A0A2N0QUC3_9GLOM|nr:hypothetical protein RhiirA1_476867 [Rhizophagus irregularis]
MSCKWTARIFYHNYPNDSYIYAQYTSGGKNFCSKYKIITLGHYPQNIKYTQKNNHNAVQYPIPDGYNVKTEIADQMLCCETKYTLANKVLYTITWKEGRAEWMVSSERSASGAVNEFLKKTNRKKSQISGVHVFGFDIKILHQLRIEQPRELSTDKITIDKRKRPLNEIQSLSQQNKRYASFGRNAYKKVKNLILKHRMVSESEEPICICSMELENGNNIINIKYNSLLDLTRLDAYVRACDETLLSHDGYRRLAAIEARLIREYQVAHRRIEITKLINNQINIGTFNLDKGLDQQSILDDDDEPQGNPDGIIVDEQEVGNGDTINLKLSGDGRNVGRKQNHVMLTFCLLNEKDEVLKPDHQYCICLYVGKEKYETLAKVGHLFKLQLLDLQENGIYVNGVHWPIEFFLSSDWKFMYNVMGLNAPNSKYFCLYCECESNIRWDMNLKWPINKNTQSKKKPELFPVIKQKNYIPDELHLLLRISDVLMECFFNDLFKKKEFERVIKSQIEQTMKSIQVYFEFFKSQGGKWDWTSLMGPDKKKVLQHFPVTNFISGRRGEDIQKLWRDFYDLYMFIRRTDLKDSEIDNFEIKVKEWIYLFCRPNQGQINSSSQVPGLYRKEDVTPYMHVFSQHIPEFLRILKEKNLSLRFFSASSIEKKTITRFGYFLVALL